MAAPEVDLRSDTLTKPSRGMRAAMADAEVGDDVFGEDPSVRRLEERAASLFGRPAALFVPSGTMANQIAIRLHTRHGDQALASGHAHTVRYESGAAAALAGIQITELTALGHYGAGHVVARLQKEDIHLSPITLLLLENTHNSAGGTVLSMEALSEIRRVALRHGLKVHLDGARVFNACVAKGIEPKVIGSKVDTLSFCLSKGLGAPVGSLLVGSRPDILRARRYRKMLGGAMRQAGILAAAGLYALRNNIDRLAEDHRRARVFAEGVGTLPGLRVEPPETNIVMIDLIDERLEPASFVRELGIRGVKVLSFGPRRIRAVFHLDVDDQGVNRAIEACAEVCTS